MLISILLGLLGIAVVFWLTQREVFKAFKYSSLDFLLIGIICSFIFDFAKFNFKPVFQICFAFISFYAGFTFRISDFRVNETISYKITLFDVILSVSLFVVTYLFISNNYVNSLNDLGLNELLLISIACSTSSMGLIRYINQTVKHSSNKAKIAFNAVTFQQFLLLFFFTFILLLTNQSLENYIYVWLVIGLLISTIFIQLYLKHSKNELSYLVILVLLIVLFFVLENVDISPYFFMLLMGLLIANSLQSYEGLLAKYSIIKEYIIYTMLIICGTLLVVNGPVFVFAFALILLRLTFKVLSQRLGALLINDPNNESKSYAAFFLSHGRFSILLAGTLFFVTDNFIYQYLIAVFAISVIFFEYLGKVKYKALLLSSKTSNSKVSS